MKKKIIFIIGAGIILVIIVILLIFKNEFTFQYADLSDVKGIKHPAYPEKGPVILLDESHGNFHTMAGTYKPFVQLLTSDGYRFRPLRGEIANSRLQTADVLVIANPTEPLKQSEINALVDWVTRGGSVLLISDHPPFATPLQELCRRFNIKLSGKWTADPDQLEPNALSPTWIRFQRSHGGLGQHPICEGRFPDERIDSITTFTGQSLHAETGVALLKLSGHARNYETREQSKAGVGGESTDKGEFDSQAVALELGKGRVVVVGEAGLLTAQVIRFLFFNLEKFGFNRPGNDNRQFLLNIMHWLTRLI
jgi:hypothetical protein